MNKKKINIGLDIGITSVGWSIIDDEYNILNLGVRTFDDVLEWGELKNGEYPKFVGSHKLTTFLIANQRKCRLWMEKWTKEKSARFIDQIEKNNNCFIDLKQYQKIIYSFKVYEMKYRNNSNFIDISLIDLNNQIFEFKLPIYFSIENMKLNNTFHCILGWRKIPVWKEKIQQMIIDQSKKVKRKEEIK